MKTIKSVLLLIAIFVLSFIALACSPEEQIEERQEPCLCETKYYYQVSEFQEVYIEFDEQALDCNDLNSGTVPEGYLDQLTNPLPDYVTESDFELIEVKNCR